MIAHRIGLTGSIGMGKSTTAALFMAEDVPVWDADAVVHRLYTQGGAAVVPLGALIPDAVQAGAVDRIHLRQALLTDPALMKQVESIVHPLVGADRTQFVAENTAPIILFDIPLLFETGQAQAYDSVVVVSAPAAVQRERVLARDGMTVAAFEAILAKQVPDAEKRAQADHVIDTSQGMDAARDQVRAILDSIRGTMNA
ncbi:dephospho-CoA kinase [Monaibacterium marinum]|uniref:Dephospho-CoA kinase n=1 Tax=Pontivivens marinum TaxID=1690039 RepID=A0A2C9CP17_9RHOB|nr:dephospho-CoA kinase [Monaibacterium marinum]SOH93271.1 dephospho-CoA kinase [Monaibacterium marinum]